MSASHDSRPLTSTHCSTSVLFLTGPLPTNSIANLAENGVFEVPVKMKGGDDTTEGKHIVTVGD